MPLFICEECGTIENTALGHYWSKDHVKFKDSSKNNKALCSSCIPAEYDDSSETGRGKWHGKFPKETFDPKKHNPDHYLNSKEYMEKHTP